MRGDTVACSFDCNNANAADRKGLNALMKVRTRLRAGPLHTPAGARDRAALHGIRELSSSSLAPPPRSKLTMAVLRLPVREPERAVALSSRTWRAKLTLRTGIQTGRDGFGAVDYGVEFGKATPPSAAQRSPSLRGVVVYRQELGFRSGKTARRVVSLGFLALFILHQLTLWASLLWSPSRRPSLSSTGSRWAGTRRRLLQRRPRDRGHATACVELGLKLRGGARDLRDLRRDLSGFHG